MKLINSFTNITVLSATFNQALALRFFMESALAVLDQLPNVNWVIFDDASTDLTPHVLKKILHPRLTVIRHEQTIGKGNMINQFIRDRLSQAPLPDVILSIDADIMFSVADFGWLAQAAADVPNIGFISMAYRNNLCNPERNLFFPARKYKGYSGEMYRIKKPFLCNVAGGIIALPARTLSEDLNYELYPHSIGKTYYPDDAFLYDKLKKRGRLLGYLQGTEAYHLRSGPHIDYPERAPSL